MDQSNVQNEGIVVFDDFVCQAIPGKSTAGQLPESATPSRVTNEGLIVQNKPLPADMAVFRSRLDRLHTSRILSLVRQGGLTPEQRRAVYEVAASRVATRQSEVQQLNEILRATSPT